jgi:hypothetical protein
MAGFFDQPRSDAVRNRGKWWNRRMLAVVMEV